MKTQILFIDDDKPMHTMLNDALEDFDITSAYSGSDGLEEVKNKQFDLILLDIGLTDMDGYEVCKNIRSLESGPHTPVIFLSGKKSLDDILKGYESGGTDYLTKPFKIAELMAKIEVENSAFQLEKKLQTELSEVTEVVLSVQNNNAKIYSINNFLQQSFFCKDSEALCQLFFSVTQSFGTEATIYIHSQNDSAFYTSSGKHHPMSNAVLEQLHAQGERIFQFGNNRSVFNWESASVLINEINDDADDIAMLMDGFEMGLNAIDASNNFENILSKYRELKSQQSIQIAQAFDDVIYEIQDELGQLGYNSLSEEQENALIRVVENKRDKMEALFSQGQQLEDDLSTVMKNLRSDNREKQEESDDGIDFF
ncbi:MAG: response regulator [gamma proteobacterium symbiont of Taylorina sp.]|nr:response regulator [gamma proteobacterium symbiont of Taylorina sp.]